MSTEVVWHRLTPEELEWAWHVGERRAAAKPTRNLQGAVAASQMTVKVEYAYRNLLNQPPPAINTPHGYSYDLSRYRVLIRANGRIAIKDLRCPTGKGELRPENFDIVLLGVTAGVEDPWVGLVGWTSSAGYLQWRRRAAVDVGKDENGKKRPLVEMLVVTRDHLNEVAAMPGWPAERKALPAPAYQNAEGQQNRLL